ncbi:hypothetical protein U1701_09010 [Sphingomonas sp. PB2P19]|uniref:hypothetical protein n=1 Tax=Sphingomonas rhamnosi TaxID=3096156 RepID=UPI002FC781A9
MADYYTQTCFKLTASDTEIAILLELDRYDEDDPDTVTPSSGFLSAFPPTSAHPLSGYLDYIEEEGQCHSPSFAHSLKKRNGEWYFADGEMYLGYVSAVLAKVCVSAFPIRFSWACICSSMREDEFGGGVTIIDENGISGWSTLDAVDQWRAAA